jgi:hypothetical protein
MTPTPVAPNPASPARFLVGFFPRRFAVPIAVKPSATSLRRKAFVNQKMYGGLHQFGTMADVHHSNLN